MILQERPRSGQNPPNNHPTDQSDPTDPTWAGEKTQATKLDHIADQPGMK